jgi:hypothetical protein
VGRSASGEKLGWTSTPTERLVVHQGSVEDPANTPLKANEAAPMQPGRLLLERVITGIVGRALEKA